MDHTGESAVKVLAFFAVFVCKIEKNILETFIYLFIYFAFLCFGVDDNAVTFMITLCKLSHDFSL